MIYMRSCWRCPLPRTHCNLLCGATTATALAAAIRVGGEQLAFDASRAALALARWREQVSCSNPGPSPLSRNAAADTFRVLLQNPPTDVDWPVLGASLALSLPSVPTAIHQALQAAVDCPTLWGPLVRALSPTANDDEVTAAIATAQSLLTPLPVEPEWVQRQLDVLPSAPLPPPTSSAPSPPSGPPSPATPQPYSPVTTHHTASPDPPHPLISIRLQGIKSLWPMDVQEALNAAFANPPQLPDWSNPFRRNGWTFRVPVAQWSRLAQGSPLIHLQTRNGVPFTAVLDTSPAPSVPHPAPPPAPISTTEPPAKRPCISPSPSDPMVSIPLSLLLPSTAHNYQPPHTWPASLASALLPQPPTSHSQQCPRIQPYPAHPPHVPMMDLPQLPATKLTRIALPPIPHLLAARPHLAPGPLPDALLRNATTPGREIPPPPATTATAAGPPHARPPTSHSPAPEECLAAARAATDSLGPSPGEWSALTLSWTYWATSTVAVPPPTSSPLPWPSPTTSCETVSHAAPSHPRLEQQQAVPATHVLHGIPHTQ
jgi:hypothetical protein